MKKATFNPLTPEQLADLEALAALPDDQIDTSDAPELSDWSQGIRGLFYRPIKQQITLRIDADVIAWFKRSKHEAKGTKLTLIVFFVSTLRNRQRKSEPPYAIMNVLSWDV